MNLRYLGYAAQNLTLKRTTNRTLRLANLDERVAGVIEQNLADLRAILEWNLSHGIRFFRVGSSVIPFGSHPDFPLDWETRFADTLEDLRRFISENNLRLAMHPGQYTVLNSPNEAIVTRALAELDYHARFLDRVAPEGTLTLHIGGAYGDKAGALETFRTNFQRLSERVKTKLTLENDDKIFAVDEVLYLCEHLNIPAIFDFFHHACYPGQGPCKDDLTGTLQRVVATWGGRVPKFHLSSPRDISTAHADMVTREDFEKTLRRMREVNGDEPFDLMLEAKAKEKAVLEVMRFWEEGLSGEYALKWMSGAMDEWEASGESEVWDKTAGDGVDANEAR